MNNLDKQNLQVLRKDLEAAFASVAAKHNLAIKTGRCTFFPTNATMDITISVLDSSGQAQTKEMEDLKWYSKASGRPMEKLMVEFKTFTGEYYTLCGYCPRKPKFPFLAINKRDGKRYGLTRGAVLTALGFPIPVGEELF